MMRKTVIAGLLVATGGALALSVVQFPAMPLLAQEAAGRQAASGAARQPMRLGAATNFSQGAPLGVLGAAESLPVRHFRDGGRWSAIERERGSYRLDIARANFPARLSRSGGDLILTVNWGNRHYDGGRTPYSAEGLEALGRFVAAMVERHPNIRAVEVGNEFNSANFVNGPVRDAGIARRGAYHLNMVRAVGEAVDEVRPGVRILGGATHSLPAGYLWPILDEDEEGLIDGLALHPYTTPIDQLAAQIGVVRRHPAARDMPIEITEWGTKDHELAPDHLLRGYAALAALGVESLYWYPLNERGDGYAALIDRAGNVTRTGEAFRYVQARLGQRIARDVSPDPFTKAYLFDDDTLVIWGEPRDVQLAAGLTARNAAGEVLSGPFSLAADRALVIEAERTVALGENVRLGCSALVADSFYQFAFPGEAGGNAGAGRFVPFAVTANSRANWLVRPGQERAGVPWTPYLSLDGTPQMRLTASGMRVFGDAQIGHEFLPRQTGPLHLEARLQLAGRGPGELRVSLRNGEAPITVEGEARAVSIDQMINLQQGQGLTILASVDGQGVRNISYRLRLHDRARCRALAQRAD